MLNWASDFLEQCLSGIPEGRYTRRLRKELESHLAALEADLTAAGYPPEEARAEAVRRMGDPAALNREYLAQWRRSLEGRLYGLGRGAGDILICLAGSAVSWLCGVALTLAMSAANDSTVVSSTARAARCLIMVYLVAYLVDAVFLRAAFRGRPGKRLRVTAGLLLTWAVEKIYEFSMFQIPAALLPGVLFLLVRTEFPVGLFIGLPNLLGTLAACFLLGRLFGGGEGERHRQAA